MLFSIDKNNCDMMEQLSWTSDSFSELQYVYKNTMI